MSLYRINESAKIKGLRLHAGNNKMCRFLYIHT